MLPVTTVHTTRRRWVACAAVGVCFVVAVIAPDPDRYQRSWLTLHDFLHVPGFTLITAALFFGFATGSRPRPPRPLHFLGVCVAALAVGIGIELAQAATVGSADPWDVVRDAGGIAVAALLMGAQSLDVRSRTRWLLRSVALVVVLASFVPTLAALADETRARRSFPILADFGASSELTRFTWSQWSSANLVAADGPDARRRVLRLALSPGKYPGLSFEFFPRDWRAWRAFVLVCTNPGAEPLPLTIRIDDLAHNHEYADRYNGAFWLAPGRNEIRIPLSDVASAPRSRRLNLAQVKSVVLFAHNLEKPHELLVQELRLVP
jgi:hypothetical protein